MQVKEGQIALHIAGYPGIQVLSATELIHCIPINKIKVAAEKFLKRTGVKKKKRKKRNSPQGNEKRQQENGNVTQKEGFVNDDGSTI